MVADGGHVCARAWLRLRACRKVAQNPPIPPRDGTLRRGKDRTSNAAALTREVSPHSRLFAEPNAPWADRDARHG
jgi:hypothetical protein